MLDVSFKICRYQLIPEVVMGLSFLVLLMVPPKLTCHKRQYLDPLSV